MGTKRRDGLLGRTIMVTALLVPMGWTEAWSATVVCEGPSVDAWVSAAAERVRMYDDLFAFAVDKFGEPTACEGRTTTEFDGAQFGTVQYAFSSGVSFHLETMPPAVSIVTLRSEDGFADPEGVVDAVRLYSAGRGLSIDWEAPERGGGAGAETEQYWDPDPGLNGSVTITRVGGALVAVRVSMAP